MQASESQNGADYNQFSIRLFEMLITSRIWKSKSPQRTAEESHVTQ